MANFSGRKKSLGSSSLKFSKNTKMKRMYQWLNFLYLPVGQFSWLYLFVMMFVYSLLLLHRIIILLLHSILQVDCTKETPLCAKQNIRAYPT